MLRVSVRNLLAHMLRLVLSALAVILGVAFVSGTMIFTDTLEKTFTDLFETSSADVNVQPRGAFDSGLTGTAVGGTRPSLPDTVVAQVRGVPGVAAAEGYVQTEGVYVLDQDGKVLNTGGAPGIGTNWSDDEDLSAIKLLDGHAPTSEDEVVLDAGTVEKTGFDLGDTVTILTTGPRVEARLVGVLQYGDGGGLAGASLTAFEVQTAQRLLLEPGKFSGVGVSAAEGVSNGELKERIQQALGAEYEVKTGAEQAQALAASLEEELSFVNIFLLVFAGVALFVGTFIILNTFSMLVAQRTRELALLRALGASRRQVTGSVLLEALPLGIIGSAAGLLLGLGLAKALKAIFESFGLTLDGSLVFALDTMVWSVAVGVVVTLLAAYLPARRAAKVPPIAAMRPEITPPARSLRGRLLLASPLAAFGVAGLLVGPTLQDGGNAALLSGMGAAALVTGTIIVSPLLATPCIHVLGAWLPRVAGKTGQLARENAARNPRRTAATSSALMIGLALVTGFSIIGASTKASVDASIGDTMKADYVISSALGAPFTTEVSERIETLKGVDSVTRTRFGVALFDKDQEIFVAYDGSAPDSLSMEFVQGELSDLAGDGFLVDEEGAKKGGWKVGDVVTFQTATGPQLTLTLRGVFERNNTVGSHLVSMQTYDQSNGPPLDRYVYVNLADDAGPAVRDEIAAIVGSYPVVDLKDREAFKEEQRGQVDQMLLLINALLVLSVIIAVLGVVNTLVLSVIERTRELGLLKAVGMNRPRIRRMVRLESVLISLYGAVLGLTLGAAFGISLTKALASKGVTETVVPWPQLVAFLLLGAVIGIAAAAFPARRAARLPVLEAIASQ